MQSSQIPTTIAGWLNLTTKSGSQQCFWGQLLGNTNAGFSVYYDSSSSDRFWFDCDAGTNKDLSAGVYLCANACGSPSVGTWYLTIVELDLVKNRATISIDNGPQNTLAPILQISSNSLSFVLGDQAVLTVPVSDTNWHLVVAWCDKPSNQIHINLDHGAASAIATGPAMLQTVRNDVRCGSDSVGGNGHQFVGILNAWGIAEGVPTQADVDTLWNNGKGWVLPVLRRRKPWPWVERLRLWWSEWVSAKG